MRWFGVGGFVGEWRRIARSLGEGRNDCRKAVSVVIAEAFLEVVLWQPRCCEQPRSLRRATVRYSPFCVDMAFVTVPADRALLLPDHSVLHARVALFTALFSRNYEGARARAQRPAFVVDHMKGCRIFSLSTATNTQSPAALVLDGDRETNAFPPAAGALDRSVGLAHTW